MGLGYKDSLGTLILNGQYYEYIALRVLYHGLAAGMWAVCGLLLSSIWLNPYIAIFSPAFIAYFKCFIYTKLSIYPSIYLYNFEHAQLYIPGALLPTIVIASVFLGLSALLTAVFVIIVKRRIRHA
jgi:hypothetical protein